MAVADDGPAKIWWIFVQRGVEISRHQAFLLNALLGRERFVSTAELIDAVYGGDPTGGPLHARNMIARFVMNARRQIAKADLPWRIETVRGLGYRLRYLKGTADENQDRSAD